MLKKSLPIFIVTGLAISLIILKVNPAFIHNIGSKKTSQNVKATQADQILTSKNAKHKDMTLAETFPFENKAREEFAKKYPGKFAIVKKMYYAWDYIHNAQGEFESGDTKSDMKREQFYVDFDKKINLSEHEIIRNGKVVEKEKTLLKGGIVTRQLLKKGIYTRESLRNNPRESFDVLENQQLGLGNKWITESEWYYLIYNNYPDWSYKVEMKGEMPVYQIEGEIKDKISESLAGHFTMTVAKDTGALLDLKCYGHDNKAIFFIDANNIQINKGINDKVFKLNTAGDREVSNKEYGQKLIGANAQSGKKTGGVSK